MTVLQQRFFFGTLLLGGVLLALFADQRLSTSGFFLALIVLFGGVSWIEFSRMTGIAWRAAFATGLVAVVALPIVAWLTRRGDLPVWGTAGAIELGIVAAVPFFLSALCFTREPNAERVKWLTHTTLGVAYLGIPLWFVVQLRLAEKGGSWIFLAVLLIKGNDIGAYLVGRAIGRTPLTPVSPKKTVEGALGGLSLGILVALAFVWPLGLTDLRTALMIGLLGGVAGQAGDLAESLFKRAFGVKDSGALVPAFGGALDMLDSILLGVPVIWAVKVAMGA
ncbi:MAG: phosphatidate cytidylyltransferase [Planctomycetota bacterium]